MNDFQPLINNLKYTDEELTNCIDKCVMKILDNYDETYITIFHKFLVVIVNTRLSIKDKADFAMKVIQNIIVPPKFNKFTA